MDYTSDEINQFRGSSSTPTTFDVSEQNPINLDDIQEEDAIEVKRSKKELSDCWQHMTRKKVGVQNGVDIWKANCNYCNKELSWKPGSSTSHLNRHISKTCKARPIGPDPKQTELVFGGSSSTLSTFVYSQERFREGMAAYVAATEMPLCMVDSVHFTRLVQNYLQPRYTPYTRNTLRADAIKLYKKRKQATIEALQNFDSVISFTSDLWTGGNKKGYIAATAHYIDNLWILHKRIIAFRLIEYPHNADNIYLVLKNIIQEFGMQDMVRSFTFDNANVNKVVIEKFLHDLNPTFGNLFFHQRCVCHILNLIVKGGLEHIKHQLDKIRQAINFINVSPARKQAFNSLCAEYGLEERSLATDVTHRWNSTYLMLQSCEKYDKVISLYYNGRHTYGLENNLEEWEWSIAFGVKKFLKPFYDATDACSGVYYPTSSLVLQQFFYIAKTFNKYRSLPIFVDIIFSMEAIFRKYWEEVPSLFLLASVMDPRLNLTGTKAIINGISNNLSTELSHLHIESSLCEIYKYYAEKAGQSTSTYQNTFSNSTALNSDDLWDFLNSNTNVPSVSSSSSISRSYDISGSGTNLEMPSELSRYMCVDVRSVLQPHEIENFNVLSWWRCNERQYPIISKIARDLLTPPVSTVASEAAFSLGGRILSDERSRLKEDILEALICLKDWECADLRLQDKVDSIMTEELQNLQ